MPPPLLEAVAALRAEGRQRLTITRLGCHQAAPGSAPLACLGCTSNASLCSQSNKRESHAMWLVTTNEANRSIIRLRRDNWRQEVQKIIQIYQVSTNHCWWSMPCTSKGGHLVDSSDITMTMQFSTQTSDLVIILGPDCHLLKSSKVLHLKPWQSQHLILLWSSVGDILCWRWQLCHIVLCLLTRPRLDLE